MSNFRLRDQNLSDMSDMSTFFGFDNPRSKVVLVNFFYGLGLS